MAYKQVSPDDMLTLRVIAARLNSGTDPTEDARMALRLRRYIIDRRLTIEFIRSWRSVRSLGYWELKFADGLDPIRVPVADANTLPHAL